jgi:hypothetical protein
MFFAALCFFLAAQPTSAPAQQPPWRGIAPGAEHLHLEEAELLRFDLAKFRPEVLVMTKDTPRTAAALREEAGAVAAVNGGFFDEQWRSLGLRISSGKTRIGLRPRVDWGVLVVRADRAEIVHSREFKPDPAIEQAIQVGPRLVVDGHAMRLKPQSSRRTAVALDRDGRTLTLVVTPGATSAQDLAELLVRLGFHSALMLDGGPSSQLSVACGELKLELRGGYAVPDGLVVRKR